MPFVLCTVSYLQLKDMKLKWEFWKNLERKQTTKIFRLKLRFKGEIKVNLKKNNLRFCTKINVQISP